MNAISADIPMQVTKMEQISVSVTPAQLAGAIKYFVWNRLGQPDDADCDWLTDGDIIFFGSRDWRVTEDPDLALLVDAANLLAHGEALHV